MSVPFFRVPDYLDGDVLSRFVIQRSDHLAEASLADHLQDLVSACTQVSNDLRTRERTTHGQRELCRKGEKKESAARNYRFAIYRSLPRAFKHNCTRGYQPQFLLSRVTTHGMQVRAMVRFHCRP